MPLSDLVKVVNKGSHNFYAEQIFKTLGAEIQKQGTARKSAETIKNWLAGLGVDDDQALIYDGSGLSRMNLISPFSTAAILREMYFSENFDAFYNSLPIAGIDGTLKVRRKNPLEKIMYALKQAMSCMCALYPAMQKINQVMIICFQ